MVRKIKPQRTQRDTESCYFPLLPPLCPLCPLCFSETLNRKYQKVSDVLVTATQDTRDSKKIDRRGRGGSQRVVILLCVPLRSLRFFESSRKIIKSLTVVVNSDVGVASKLPSTRR